MGLLDRFKKPSLAGFAKEIQKALTKAGDARRWELVEANCQLVPYDSAPPHAKGFGLNLGNLFAEYCQADANGRAKVIANAVAVCRHKPTTDNGTAQRNVLVTLKSSIELSLAEISLRATKHTLLVQRPWLGRLHCVVALDNPQTLEYPNTESLRKLGLGEEQAFSLGLDNLRKRSQKPMRELQPGLFVSAWEDSVDCARILLPEVLQRHTVQGNPVVMIPNRSMLLLAGDADAKGLARMVELATEAIQQPRAMTTIMLRWRNGSWEEFIPPELAVTLGNLQVQDSGSDYASQKQALDKYYAQSRKDIYVAEFSATQNKQTGALRSFCAWTKGVHSLLPKTELIGLVNPEEKSTLLVPWEYVEATCGNLLQATADYLQRFEVKSFPDEQQLQHLSTSAVNRSSL